MEEAFKRVAASVALGVEASAVVLIAIGAIESIVLILRGFRPVGGRPAHQRVVRRKEVWIRFATWLLLGLEFELAADVIRTAVAPSWNDIGQLAAIAAIRTFLNFFLGKDVSEYTARAADAAAG